jgi:hypothetical protein
VTLNSLVINIRDVSRLLFGLSLLALSNLIQSQAVDQKQFISFEKLAKQIQSKNNINLFYNPAWFKMRVFNSSLLQLNLTQILKKLETETDYSIITFDSVSYIFTPVRPELLVTDEQEDPDLITIGNPTEAGKNSKILITGKVTDGSNGDILPGASVFIDKLKTGSNTNKNGEFRLTAPAGNHELRVSFMGYDELIQKVRLISDGTINLSIYSKSIKLHEVVITAQRSDLNISGTQMSYVKLDALSVKELPLSMGVTDIIKSITLLPGVQTIGEFGTGFNVRGGSADQNLILLEDVPLFNTSHLFGLISVVNSDGISGVNLYKAGIPSKYGERASSVLEMTFGPENQRETSVKGGIGIIDSHIYMETPIAGDKGSFLLSARTSYSNWLLHKVPDIDLMNSSTNFYDINSLFTFNTNPVNRISLFAYYSFDRFGFSKDTKYQYDNFLSSLRWKHTFSSDLFFNLVAGVSNYNYNVGESDTLRPREAYKIKTSLWYKNLKLNFSWFPSNSHNIEFGFNSAIYNIMPGQINPLGIASIVNTFSIQKEQALESALYFSDKYALSKRISIEGGLRIPVYNYLGPHKSFVFKPGFPLTPETVIDSVFYPANKIINTSIGLEPRLSIRYSLSDQTSLKLSYNRVHQYINLVSNTSVMTPSDFWKLSSEYIEPLKCDHIAFGYYRNFRINSIESSIEFYYKRLKNSIDYKNGAIVLLNPYIETALVNVKGSNFGAEFFVRKNTGALTGWISYTYSRSLQRTTSSIKGEQINHNRVFASNFDRPNNLVVNLNYHLSRRWRLSGTFTYSTGRPVTLPELKYDYHGYQLLLFSDRNKYRLPDYHRLDLSITYDKSLKSKKSYKGSWTFSVINLYGRQNAYSVFYKKEEHMVDNQYRVYDTYMLYIIGRPLPSLTYNFSF